MYVQLSSFLTLAVMILLTSSILVIRKKYRRSATERKIVLHETLMPMWSFVTVWVVFVALVPFGTTAFWVLLVPAVICAMVVDTRMIAEGRRHVYLKGWREPPEGKKVVPEGHVLAHVWNGLDTGPGGYQTRSPVVLIYRAGDLYNPDSDRPGSEYILVPSGERRIIRARRSLFSKIREFSLQSKDGHPKVKYLDNTD